MFKYKEIIITLAAITALSLPVLVLAQTNTAGTIASDAPGNLTELVNRIIRIFNVLVPVLILITGAIFMSGFIWYLRAGGNEEKLKEGRMRIYMGFIGLFILFSFWGLANILVKSIFK